MFGEDDSESPRRPSPWTPSPGQSASPACLDDGSSKSEFPLNSWPEELEPEVDGLGHIEYKLKILSPSPNRFEKLKTQLKWRLLEGGGTALYELGVLDDGTLIGLSRDEMDESLANLAQMARELHCELELLRVVEIPEIIINAGPSSASIPPSLKLAGGIDRKEKAKQKKKRRKSRSRSIVAHNSARPSKTKSRIEPGDADVSSDGEPCSSKEVSSQATPAIVVDPPSLSSKASIYSLRALLDGAFLHPHRPALKSNFIEQICLLTPEERSMIRIARKNEKKAAQAAQATEIRRSKAQAETSAQPSASDKITRFPDLRNQELGAWKRKDDGKGGIKYVVEVCVVKEAQAKEHRFLDFEGFGISDST